MTNTSNYTKHNPETIRSMFDTIATNYDKTNSILSLNMHKRWNSTLIREVLIANQPKTYLDLCCGTGAIAFEYLNRSEAPLTTTYLLDFSPRMLEYAQSRPEYTTALKHDIHFIEADATQIPLEDTSIDCITIAYGIRNIKRPLDCIKEAYRVLKPGGVLGILELTQPKNRVLRMGHSVYLKTMLPALGKLCTSNKLAYSYLCKSIPNFISPETLNNLLTFAGFEGVKTKSLLGGIATIQIAKKPL